MSDAATDARDKAAAIQRRRDRGIQRAIETTLQCEPETPKHLRKTLYAYLCREGFTDPDATAIVQHYAPELWAARSPSPLEGGAAPPGDVPHPSNPSYPSRLPDQLYPKIFQEYQTMGATETQARQAAKVDAVYWAKHLQSGTDPRGHAAPPGITELLFAGALSLSPPSAPSPFEGGAAPAGDVEIKIILEPAAQVPTAMVALQRAMGVPEPLIKGFIALTPLAQDVPNLAQSVVIDKPLTFQEFRLLAVQILQSAGVPKEEMLVIAELVSNELWPVLCQWADQGFPVKVQRNTPNPVPVPIPNGLKLFGLYLIALFIFWVFVGVVLGLTGS